MDHVGLYVGAGEFIHSSSSGVRVSSLRNSYWRESLVAARRIVE
jgi:peptidoglycan endopeptidase LytE